MSFSTLNLTSRIGNWISATSQAALASICDYIKSFLVSTSKAVGKFALDTCGDMLSGLTGHLCAGLGYAENVMYVFRVVMSLSDFLSTLYKPFLTLDPVAMLKVTFGLDFYTRLSILCINLYDLCKSHLKNAGLRIREEEPELPAQAQSGESSLLMNLAMSALLPAGLKHILKDFSIFSNFKVLDDCSMVFDFISLFFRIPIAIYKYFLPEENTLPQLLNSLEVYFPFGQFGGLKWKLNGLLDKLDKKPTIIGDGDFQDEYQKIFKDFMKFLNDTWDNKKDYPVFVQKLVKRATSVNLKIEYMRDSQRQEPGFFVFYGPAGTGKTTMMNGLVKLYTKAGSSVYVHSTSSDSKDFHDQYDNEYLYVADDVGQKGVWQWSSYINMVSTTKYPLECAVAEKKDTKFFTSKVIFCTTNLIDLTITPTCGITDLGALHRRMNLLDFTDVKFNSGHYTGTLRLKRYSLETKKFLTTTEMNLTDVDIRVIYTNIDMWMKNIVAQKAAVHANDDLDDFTLNAFPEALTEEVTQKIEAFKSFCSYLKDELVCALGRLSDFVVANVNGNVAMSMVILMVVMFAPLIRAFLGIGETLEYETPKSVTNAVTRTYRSDRKDKMSLLEAMPQSLAEIFQTKRDTNFSSLTRIERQTFGVQCIYQSKQGQVTSEFCSLFSGQYFTAPAHGVRNVTPDIYVNVYRTNLNRIYDHVMVTKVYENLEDDLCILKLPDRLPIYSRSITFAKDSQSPSCVLVTPGAQRIIKQLRKTDLNVSYFKADYKNVIPSDEALVYEFHAEALCGCVTVTPDNFLIGHHVAYAESIKSGIIRVFSNKTRRTIAEYFSRPVDFFVPLADEPVVGSKAVLDLKNFSLPNSNNTIVPSVVSGIFPKERIPAQFSDKPLNLMKKFSSLACENTLTPCLAGLNYATEYVGTIMQTSFHKWSDADVISGGGLLNSIDKKTSVGFGLSGVKTDYIDYDNLRFRPELQEMLGKFEEDILNGIYPKFFFAEQFKQELRDVEKAEKPRIFKMSPLVHTILIRRYFGDFLVYSHKNRKVTGVAVGINPFSDDWNDLMKQVTKHGNNVFGIDFEKWDKRMLSAFQQKLNEVILSRCQFNDRDFKIAEFLLNSVFMTPCVVVDETYITTHSLASGGGLTAEYNSWIHKMYTAYCFCNLYFEQFSKVPTLYDYINNVENVAYGDDGLNGVSDGVKSWFNGISVSREMAKIGLAATNEVKGAFDYETRGIEECSFLKRQFRFHYGLGRIVAPLDLKSVKSTLNFVKDDFRNEELTRTKLQNFQREIFLHESQYSDLLDQAVSYCKLVDFPFTPLTQEYLSKLYTSGCFADLLFLGSI